MKSYWKWAISLLAVLTLGLAGCGGGGGGGGAPAPGVASDTDGDGIPNTEDAFPTDATRFISMGKVDLPGLQGTFSSAVAINDGNLIVGTANDNTGDIHPVFWSMTGATPSAAALLEILPGAVAPAFGAAFGINNLADTVGESEDSTGGRQAIFWQGIGGAPNPVSPTTLPALTGAQFSAAYDLNSGRRVVGESQSGGVTKAVTWLVTIAGGTVTPGAPIMLGEPTGGTASSAYFIGESNSVVGEYTTSGGAVHGILWTLDALGAVTSRVDLPPLVGDTESVAYGINDAGQIVGESSSATSSKGVLWTVAGGTATATLLGTPAGGEGNAFGVNDSGRLAGFTAPTAGGAATMAVWDLRNPSLFNNVVTSFSQGYGINNGGNIVGMANNAAFVAVPQ